MLDILKRLLSPEYLVVSEPGPLGTLWLLYAGLGLFFACSLGLALWALTTPQRPGRRAWAWFTLWLSLAGFLAVLGRFWGWPGWSARIWPYSFFALILAGAAVYRWRNLHLPAWSAEVLTILSLRPAVSPQGRRGPGTKASASVRSKVLDWGAYFGGLSLHLGGIALVLTARYGWPAWSALPLLALLLIVPQTPLVAQGRRPRLAALTPLFAAYALTALWLIYGALHITVIGWQGLAFPNPLVSLFYVDGIILAACTYAVLAQIYVTITTLERPAQLWHWALAGLLLATLAWAIRVYFGQHTHGATASDPYAYAQMGVDLAERGTFLHRFSLFQEVMPLDIAWAPLQPVGYHIPRNDLGDCPSVWATGASALLAAGYQLFGEVGLYVTTPVVALLALFATWALVQEALRGEPRGVRYGTAVLTVSLLASSPEHVDRLLVPMADAAAQLFTVLTLLFVLRAIRGHAERWNGGLWWILAGASFAWAYWVRHTQLVLALPALLGICLASAPLDRRLRSWILPLLAFSMAALVFALPDIAYRWRWFGGPLATETTELPLMAWRHVGPVAWDMLRASLAAGEWGYLFPLALYGTYQLVRRHQHAALILGSGFAAVLLVHLTYHSLRLRDLISLFPLVDLAVAYGAVALVRRAWALSRERKRRLGPALLPVVTIAWIVLSFGLARWSMIDNLWKPGWASFGYMRAEHRAAFDRLADLTPPDAVIGASLNAGAVMMYTGRDAIRPYDSWTPAEWEIFLQAMHARSRTVYLLDDGGLMADFIQTEKARHHLTPIEELQVPLFYTQGRDTGWVYRLDWDE
ncbi:MAG: glycosyltransferase family 39 protein [Anaerolineae bacterium]